eukprot:SAG22_NODE_9189_length_604_cov_1.067327_1_plen_107_part_01
MPKKGGKKKKGGKAAKAPPDPKILERAMAKMPPPTPRGEAREAAGLPPLPKYCCNVGQLLQLKYTTNPEGLVEHLAALPELTGRLNAVNEQGWTTLMRAARDGARHA